MLASAASTEFRLEGIPGQRHPRWRRWPIGVFIIGLKLQLPIWPTFVRGLKRWNCSTTSPSAFGRVDSDQHVVCADRIGTVGTLIGVLPGIGPVATIAMLLPTTYALQPVSALIMLAGIYYGAQYGGSTTSILHQHAGRDVVRGDVPRRPPDGAQGQAGAALATAALASFFAGCVATVFIAAVSRTRCPSSRSSSAPPNTSR